MALIVFASVYLRQRGSPESKPVAEPHHETGSLNLQLRASEIARRRTEEEGAEAIFPLRATTKSVGFHARLREQLQS